MAGGESATPVFALLGHGNEAPIPYEDRERVPVGVTVVLFSAPGWPLPLYEAESIWGAMTDRPDLFQTPVQNKATIEDLLHMRMRIYEAGAPLPPMIFYPEGSMLSPGGIPRYYPAGVYKLPTTFPMMTAQSIQRIGGLTRADINRLYSGEENQMFRDLFEPILQRDGVIPLQRLKEFQFPIHTLLTRPGVYYLLNCRFVQGLKDRVDNFLRTIVSRISDGSNAEINTMKQQFRNSIQEMLGDNHTYPEHKLDSIRSILKGESRIPGVNNTQPALTNANLQSLLANPDINERTRELHKFIQEKRRLLAEFEADFGALQQRILLTRTLSNAHQMERYGRGGSKRKRRRTRKNHSLNRKRRTHGK